MVLIPKPVEANKFIGGNGHKENRPMDGRDPLKFAAEKMGHHF